MSQNEKENLDENPALDEQDCQECEADEQNCQNDLADELNKVKEDLIRATADFENIKKRLEREKAEALKFANESFARDLLPVIDALEIAANLQSGDDEIANKIKDGINLTIEQFKKCFEKYGIKEIDTTGEFNPEFHQAVLTEHVDGFEEGYVVDILQKGYMYKDRVLRPAMVKVSE